jgi:hypothetical protein
MLVCTQQIPYASLLIVCKLISGHNPDDKQPFMHLYDGQTEYLTNSQIIEMFDPKTVKIYAHVATSCANRISCDAGH